MARRVLESLLVQPWLDFSRRLTYARLQRSLRLAAAPPQRQAERNGRKQRLLYVAASVRPYHMSGYTMRTHAIARALLNEGIDAHFIARPGYPWDRRDALEQPNTPASSFAASEASDAEPLPVVVNTFGDVPYHHFPAPLNNRPVLFYARQGAEPIIRWAREHGIDRIHAASNHVSALPALLAARRLGLPFQYEMRGLWELTRISRQPGFLDSQAYKQGLQLEALVARHADRLFVISEQLGQYMVARANIDPERIHLLPNCVDPDDFIPVAPEQVQTDVIGYAGTLIGYEGLDVLIDALHRLREQGRRVRLELMGAGEAQPALQEQVQRLGLGDQVQFLGRMAPEKARSRLARCALICLPRKPYQVCKIVPPLKLAEALAMARPVVLPHLPVFVDELGPTPPGWFFKAGDSSDLARVLESALADEAALHAMGARAREHVVATRNWKAFVPQLV